MTVRFDDADSLAGRIVATVGRHVILGLPVGIGKAVHVADALYARALRDRSLTLTLFTGLTLEAPVARGEIERRLLEPLSERLYADWPTPAYARAVRANALPPNIRVHEFYLRPGAYLGNPTAQRNYASINYSQVVRALVDLGVNVVAQLVAARDASPGKLSLASNPEVTLDLLPHFDAQRADGRGVAMVAQVNPALPYMAGDAELDTARFDFVLDDRQYDFPLFGLPNRPVRAADYAIGMHVASLVPDGGTLQIGIGSLSDAVAHCLRLRHTEPAVFDTVLRLLPGGSASPRRAALPLETAPFVEGLYSSTELLSDALFSLYRGGILCRPAGAGSDAFVHAGFFVGSRDLYAALRELDDAAQRHLCMTRISFTNTLYGDEQKKRQQRRHARFVNETMLVTLLGAAASDALDNGRIVSGVGGQFDFVSMAHNLDDAQSILMVRASRMHDGRPVSNLRWSYAESTVPRHHRDVYVSEYGIAATRGQTDRQVIEALLGIADAAFRPALLAAAADAGKLPAGFRLPPEADRNTPAALNAVFARQDIRPHFPRYPFGTDLTAEERNLVDALEWLKEATARPLPAVRTAAAALLVRTGNGCPAEITRLGLDRPATMRERFLGQLVRYALLRTAAQATQSG